MTTGPNALTLAERTATLLSLITVFGSSVFRITIARPMRRDPATSNPIVALRLEDGAKRNAAIAAIALVLLAGLRLHLQVIALFDTWDAVGVNELRALIADSKWGHAWMLQIAASLVIAAGPFVGRALDLWMAIPLALSAAMNGHAMATGALVPVTLIANTLHILAASAWVAGVFYIFLATVITSDPMSLLRIVRGFNTVALVTSGVAAGTGTLLAAVHVGSFHALFASEYGNALIWKLAFVASMAALGAYNWKRSTPHLTLGDASALRRGVRAELLFALLVVLATARLVVLPMPE